MKNTFLKYMILALSFSGFVACEKEYEIITEEREEPSEVINLVRGNIEGIVVDKSGATQSDIKVDLIVNAKVLSTKFTNDDGTFEFSEDKVNQDGTLLRFTNENYATSFQYLEPKENTRNFTVNIVKSHEHISEFSGDNTLSLETSEYAFDINKVQLENDATSVKTSLLDSEDLKSKTNQLLIGIDQNNTEQFLDFEDIISIEIENNQLKANEQISVLIQHQLPQDGEYFVWCLDEKLMRWVESGAVTTSESSYSFSTNKIGLLGLAKKSQLAKLSGEIRDDSGNPIYELKVSLEDEQNTETLFTYTNSEGFYSFYSKLGLEGTLNVQGASFDEYSESINITSESQDQNIEITTPKVCRNIELELDNNCQTSLTPNQLFNLEEGSSSALFTIEIRIAEVINSYSSIGIDVPFGIEDFSIFGFDSDVTYNATLLDLQGNLTGECSGTIRVIDQSIPQVQCAEMVTSTLNPITQDLTVWAEDLILFASDNCTSEGDLTYRIARKDLCDGECLDSDFTETLIFDTEDANHQKAIVVRVMDQSGNYNDCDALILVVNTSSEDNTPPTIVCPSETTIKLKADGTAKIPVEVFIEAYSDNSNLPGTFSVIRNGDCCTANCDQPGQFISFCTADIGKEIAVTITATDPSDNSNSCWGSVVVLAFDDDTDCTSPVVICEENIVFQLSDGIGKLLPAAIDNGSFDDSTSDENLIFKVNRTDSCCSDECVTENGVSYDAPGDYVSFCEDDLGKIVFVTMVVYDEAGNSNTCITSVSVQN